MITKIYIVIVAFLSVLSAHETFFSDDEIIEQTGFVIDGAIEDKRVDKIEIIPADREVYRYVLTYTFRIDSVIKGAEDMPDVEFIELLESGLTDDKNNLGSLSVGDTFRYFANRGKTVDGVFIPASIHEYEAFKAGKAAFPVDPNYVRKHLYQKEVSRIPKNIETSRSDSKALNGSSDSSNPVAQPNRYNKKVSVWWLLFIAIFCAIIFLIVRSKIKSRKLRK